jgi:hypothetical protein
MLKVLTSWIRNRTYKFLAVSNLMDEKIQRGFWSGVSGTVEHTETRTYIINQARTKQKSVCITLCKSITRGYYREESAAFLPRELNAKVCISKQFSKGKLLLTQ